MTPAGLDRASEAQHIANATWSMKMKVLEVVREFDVAFCAFVLFYILGKMEAEQEL